MEFVWFSYKFKSKVPRCGFTKYIYYNSITLLQVILVIKWDRSVIKMYFNHLTDELYYAHFCGLLNKSNIIFFIGS